MKYNKLVRDKIPEIIENGGTHATVHIATDEEYRERIHAKLQEEVDEYLESQRTEEIADIIEVLYALCDLHEISREDLEKMREQKALERGSFTKRIVLDETHDQ